MIWMRRAYSLYVLICFSLVFLLLMPFFFIAIQLNHRGKVVFFINRIWAVAFFAMIGMPNRYYYREKLKSNQNYIFCANHFSYLDIPILGRIPNDAIYVGKSSLSKIPVFGYMFRRIHLGVNRENPKSFYTLLERAKEALDHGKSLIIFPEGGIMAKNPPEMARFKDGAFRLAIEKQAPIVPVIIPYNWLILPDDDTFAMRWHKSVVIFEKPVATEGLTLDDLPKLKEQVYQIIDQELRKLMMIPCVGINQW
jgi:1-acyl-sn-glycerol-3-phosphate acyltransferase